MERTHNMRTKYLFLSFFIGITLLLFVAQPINAEEISLADLIELFIALEIIPPEKAEQARAVVKTQAQTRSNVSDEIFSRDLEVGDTGEDVKLLQQTLNADTKTRVSYLGDGSAGRETTYFGSKTKAAVVKFQEIYAVDILVPAGLTKGTGYVGPSTRRKLNGLARAEKERLEGLSVFENLVEIKGPRRTNEAIADKEYITLTANRKNTGPINITGWTLKSGATFKSATIGRGVAFPNSKRAVPDFEEPIFLEPNARAIIITGKSPKGISFRLNKCTGYFEQFKDYSPPLPKKCPRARDEGIPPSFTDECITYIERLRTCEVHIEAFPLGVNADCQGFINEKVHYSGCIALHRDDTDFFGTEWRVFLGRGQELWKNKLETIQLLDENGKIVDTVSY